MSKKQKDYVDSTQLANLTRQQLRELEEKEKTTWQKVLDWIIIRSGYYDSAVVLRRSGSFGILDGSKRKPQRSSVYICGVSCRINWRISDLLSLFCGEKTEGRQNRAGHAPLSGAAFFSVVLTACRL